MSNRPEHPHEFHPDLATERLQLIAQVVQDEIGRAMGKFAGETKVGWSRGCTVYEGVKNALETMGLSTAWLKYQQERGMAYSVRIGEVPIRVQRFDDEPKPAMDFEKDLSRRAKTQVPFPLGMTRLSNCLVRIEFEIVGDEVRCHLRVWNVKEDDPVLYHSWELGTVAVDAAPADVRLLGRAEAVELPPADFGVDGAEQVDDNDESDVG